MCDETLSAVSRAYHTIFILHCASPLHSSLTTEEETEIRLLAASRKESIRLVQRARVILAMLDDPKFHATHASFKAGFQSQQMGITWAKRFNAEGIAGLQDKPKTGRLPTHDQKVRSALISLVQQTPDTLGYPSSCGHWNVYRLPSRSARVSIYRTRPFRNGSKVKGSNGNDSRVGFTKPKNMTRSSCKKGEHHNGVSDPNSPQAGDWCGRNGTDCGQDLSRRRKESWSKPGDF